MKNENAEPSSIMIRRVMLPADPESAYERINAAGA
jgi:hypothetical protein